ncbi:MAG: hypothetical protein CTY33_07470 [Methylotenera sp.]|nr:MAG: hypothetical protein CTY33_07470 [Methylotenera sp.]
MKSILKKLGLETKVLTGIHPERKLQVMDSQYETLYQSINKLAATITSTPLAMITFYNEQHVWVESDAIKSDTLQYTHNETFYNWAITNKEYIEISDTSLISDQGPHALNRYYPNLKFYAGVPLKLPLGEVIGVLSVFDIKPNSMNPHQKSILVALADVVAKSMVFKHHLIMN